VLGPFLKAPPPTLNLPCETHSHPKLDAMSVATMSPRRTALSQAIDEVASLCLDVNVSNTLPVYMRIIGFSTADYVVPTMHTSSNNNPNSIVSDGIRAFERALEKSHGSVDTRAWKLWNEYFYKKLGGPQDGDGICHWCETCGRICFKGKKDACSKMLEQKEKRIQAQKQLQAAAADQEARVKRVKKEKKVKKTIPRRESLL